MGRDFKQLLQQKWHENKFVCIGLDPEWGRLPESLRLPRAEHSPMARGTQYSAFCKSIVDDTKDVVGFYKLDLAFYVEDGHYGLIALRNIIEHIHLFAPEVPVILDAKYGGAIQRENLGYARQAFDYLRADAVTVSPYSGQEALRPFLDRKDKGVFVVCRTSGKGSGEFQNYMDTADDVFPGDYMPLYEYVAHRVANFWNENGNCGLVVGANRPEELSSVRGRVLDMPILSPAVGVQQEGVPLEEQVRRLITAGKYGDALPIVVSSSRGIIFAENPRATALELNELVNRYR